MLDEAGRLAVRREQQLDLLEVVDRIGVLVRPVVLESRVPHLVGLALLRLDLERLDHLVQRARGDEEVEALDVAAERREADDVAVLIDRGATGVTVRDRRRDLEDLLAARRVLDRRDRAVGDRGLELRLLVEQVLRVGDPGIAEHHDVILDLRARRVADRQCGCVLDRDLEDRAVVAAARLAERLDLVLELGAIRHDHVGPLLDLTDEPDLGLEEVELRLRHPVELGAELLPDPLVDLLTQRNLRGRVALLDVIDDVRVRRDVAIRGHEPAGAGAADRGLDRGAADLVGRGVCTPDAHDGGLRDQCDLLLRARLFSVHRRGDRQHQRAHEKRQRSTHRRPSYRILDTWALASTAVHAARRARACSGGLRPGRTSGRASGSCCCG